MENGYFLRLLVALLTMASLADAFVFNYSPPKIEPPEKERIITAGRTLTLICSGEQPVTWELPKFDDDLRESFLESTSVISVSYDPYSTGPYKVMLEVFNTSVINVGFYTCLFNTTDDTENLEEMEQKGQAARVYVYVNDPVNLAVPMGDLVLATQHSPVIIPCRPSSPDVNVVLYKGTEKVDAEFDDKVGFTYIFSSVYGEDGYFCNMTSGTVSSIIELVTHITPMTYSVSVPTFNEMDNDFHTEIDGTIKLNCSYYLIEPGVRVQLSWKYPVEKSPTLSKRVIISNTTTHYTNSRKRAQILLTVQNVTQEDQGIYECGVVDANENTNKKEQFVTVHEKGYSFVSLSSDDLIIDPNKYTPGKPAKKQCLTCNISAYPQPKITWYDNHGKEIVFDFQSIKYTQTTNRIHSQLCIDHLSVHDTGIYKVKASTPKKSAVLNFTLNIEVSPTADIKGRRFQMVDQISRTPCEIISNPVPEVQWSFRECYTSEQCSRKTWIPVNESHIEPLVRTDSFSFVSFVRYPAVKSGQLNCQAKNSMGSGNSIFQFYVTDIGDSFGISGYKEPVAVRDNLTVICGASKFVNYTGAIHWYKMPNRIPIENDENKGYLIAKEDSEYSYQLIMSIPNINKTFNGNYLCSVEKRMYDGSIEMEEDSLKLDIKDETKPIITATNMNNSDLKLALGTPKIHFYCKVKGIPYPNIQWFKDDVPFVFDGKDQRIRLVDNNTRMEIDYIKDEDIGIFRCSAVNRVGKISRFINLKLNYQPINIVYIVGIAVLALVLIILIIFLACKVQKEKKIRKELSLVGLLHFEKGATESLNPELGLDEQAELLPYDKKWEFARDKLKLGRQLGSGAFGVVMKGTAYGILENEESTVVAVKMVKKTADATFIKALASELKIMVHLGKHLNVVNLLGACTKNVSKRELYVIVEYCRFGNLHNYLLRHRDIFIDQIDPMTDSIDPNIGSDIINRAYSISSNHSEKDEIKDSGFGPASSGFDTNNTTVSMSPNGEQNDGLVTSNGSIQPGWRSNYKGDYNYSKEARPISTSDLLTWSFQVARGMEYLANRKVLHGDLAARNILLADDNIVKICDFGLAKSMYQSDNYQKKGDGPLPVKWMAIESIRDRVFSTQSDVWSYGIVLWELFSLARTPYPGMEADEKFYNKLVEGYRMDKPKFASKHIYNTMLECWRARPIQRPSFTELASRLGNLLEDSVRKHYIDLNDPYMVMNNRWMAESGNNDYLAMMSSPDYRNIASSNENHDYVNDPFGGSTKVNPLSPDDTDAEGYLCMSPAKTSIITTDVNIFEFPTPPHKISKAQLKDDSNVEKNEMIPMLKMGRLNSDGSTPSTPQFILGNNSPAVNSFLNPSYQTIFKEKDIEQANNYVNMSQKDSGFCEDTKGKPSPNSFSNPSYVTMNGNMLNNIKSEMAVA